jgi:hypothetical protein
MTKQTQVRSTEEAPARSALKLALEALEICADCRPLGHETLTEARERKITYAITAIREALASGASEESSGTGQPAQPQQEPVAFESIYRYAIKESKSGTLKDIAKLCYQAALIVQPAAPVSQKPSWWHKHWDEGDDIFYCNTDAIPEGATPLYTSLPAQRKPLTDEEIVAKALHLSGLGTSPDVIQFARAIEAAHGITGEQK